MNGVNTKSWAFSQRVMLDLSPYLSRDKEAAASIQAILSSFADWYTYNGKPIGTPWNYSTSHIGYNLDHVTEAGLVPPAELGDKWDWNALREYAEKLTKREGGKVTHFGYWSQDGIETGWGNFVLANGGSMLDAERKRSVIASPEAIEAVQYCVDFVLKSQTSPTPEQITDLRQGQHPSHVFMIGAISMTTQGDWYWNRYKNDPNLTWDVTFIAKSPKTGKTGNNSNFRGTVMNPASKVLDASWSWLSHSISKPVQDRIVSLFNEVPARLDSAEENYLNPEKSGAPPSRKMLLDSLKATVALPTHDIVTWTQMIREGINPNMANIWAGKVTVAEGLRQMQDQLNALFEDAEEKAKRA